MPHPWLHDDGSTVTLDLHGATVDEAVRLTRRTVQEAARRGRSTVKVIHGASTSRRLAPNRTIKNALYAELDGDAFGVDLTGHWRDEAAVTLSLDLTAARDPRPIRMRDLDV